MSAVFHFRCLTRCHPRTDAVLILFAGPTAYDRNAMLDAVTDSLKASEQVALVGFGTFAVKERAARQGRNPQTGATIEIAAAKVPSFKPGKALKDALND